MYALIAFSFFVFFAITYSVPKIRIRNKPFLGFLWNPFLALSIFAGVFLIYSKLNYEFLIIAVGISLFYFFSEILHQLDHYEIDKQKGRKTIATKTGIKAVLSFLKRTKYITIPLFVFWIYLLIFKSRLLILHSIMIITNIWRITILNKDISNNSFKRLRTKMGGKIEIILYVTYFIILDLLS
jgi:4-hydroxybenzoate polyprenyltransferase